MCLFMSVCIKACYVKCVDMHGIKRRAVYDDGNWTALQ